MSYKTSNAEGHVDFINTYDLEPMAQQVIPKAAFGYIASGAEDTFTLRENIRAFNHKLIVPHTLCNVENPSTEILSLIHISEPTRPCGTSRMPSSA